MTWWQRLFRRKQLDKELEKELQFHLQESTAKLVEQGESPKEARRQAVIKLGGIQQTKESLRDVHEIPIVEPFLRDAIFGLRIFRKAPAFAAIAVVAMALGIGFSSTVFSIFYNGVLHPFPYRDAERLTVIGIVDTAHNSERFREMYHLNEVAAFRKQAQTFEDVVAYSGWDTVFMHGNVPEPVHVCVSTPNLMQFWGVAPLLGRGISEQDAQAGAAPVALLGYSFWKKMFGGDTGVVGSTITVNKQRRTIIGVMPYRFGLYGADFYMPIRWDRAEPANFQEANDNNDPYYFFATGRIKPKVSRQTAGADLQVIAKQLATIYPKDYPEHFQMTARPMNEVIVDDFKQTVLLLVGAVLLLLLISSSNVASLLLTHHSARARELALRTALGASRGRLVRQLLAESLVLGTAGCVLGCVLAYLGLEVIHLVPGVSVPGEADMSLNLPVLLFAVLLSLITTLLFGLSPALLAVRKDLRSNLQTSGVNAGVVSQRGVRIRGGLVIAQVALSMVLLIFAGLMVRSFLAIYNHNTGISTSGLLFARMHFPAHSYEAAESKREFFDQLLPRIDSLPGVTGAAVSFGLPFMSEGGTEDVTIPGKPHEKPWRTALDAVNESYFSTVGIALLRGRLLSANDVAGARRVAVVNSMLARTYFGGENPLGRQIKFNVFDQIPEFPHDAYYEIVGVVADLKGFNSEHKVEPMAYIPYTFTGIDDRTILVRAISNPMRLANPIRQMTADVDSSVVVRQADTLQSQLEYFIFQKPKFRLISFGTCAAIGLTLALIGLFGLMSYSVTLQTHELGVRMALGAEPGNILQLVLRRGLGLVGAGIVIGLVVSFFSVRFVQSQLWGVSAFDPWTLFLAPAALLVAACLACYLPARRATQVDPIIALRYE
ncbi:MAG TPA: ABC transporter permease [Candidatus Sulfotelmatobacter sp.]|nr:ABC transporter permease [Candidatus Sulfotelmatobacter sp.]